MQTGRLYYNAPLNDLYNTTAFWQPINYLSLDPYSEFSVGSERAIGYYILLSLGVPLGFGGAVLVQCIMSIAALLFIGLTSRELFGPWGGVATLLLMSTNGPFILWSQLLLSNNAALGFFFSGLFLCIRGVNSSNSKYYPIAMILMMASFWMRYDYFWLVGLFVLFLIVERKIISRRDLLIMLSTLAASVITIITINLLLAGTITGTRTSSLSGASYELLISYPLRPFEPSVLITNLGMYFVNLAPVTIVFGVIGFISIIIMKENNKMRNLSILLLLLCFFVLYYYGKNAGFWGFETNWLASSYTRYFLVPYTTLAILAGGLASFIQNSVNKINQTSPQIQIASKSDNDSHQYRFIVISSFLRGLRKPSVYKAFTVMIISVLILLQGFLTYYSLRDNQFGLDHISSYTAERRNFDSFLYELSPDGIFVDTTTNHYYSNMLFSVTTLSTWTIDNETSESIVVDLIGNNFDVFLLLNSHRTSVFLNQSLADLGYTLTAVTTPSFRLLEEPTLLMVSI
jgi:hypothetical protein